MKLAEFSDLCWREWGQARGDVVSLALTDSSYEELRNEIVGEDEEDAFYSPLQPLEVANPVTRSMVRLKAGASTDTAEVRRHYGTRRVSQAAR